MKSFLAYLLRRYKS